jgi:diacylglycerol kinase family enzyme
VTRLADEADHVVIAYNPTAGLRDATGAAKRLAKRLCDAGLRAEAIGDLDEISERVVEYLSRGRLRAVVGAGGDGTAAELINRTPAGTPFVMLPGGTENLLSKYLGQRRGVDAAVDVIRGGLVARLDAGRVTSQLHNAGRLFLIVASCGVDADVVHRLAAARRGHIHQLSYLKPIWASIRNYGYPQVRVYFRNTQSAESGGEWQSASACWVVVTNLPRYARGLKFAPAALGTDGLFDLCLFRDGSLASGLKYLGGVMLGRHEKLSGCEFLKATHIRMVSDQEVPLQIDGDASGVLPVEMEIVPSRLSLLVSSQWAAEQGMR